MSKERPILLSAPSVRSILAGAKTQHRVPVVRGPRQTWLLPETVDAVRRFKDTGNDGWWSMAVGEPRTIVHCGREVDGGHIGCVRCHLGVPGDRLWVRESHCLFQLPGDCAACAYRATCPGNAFDYVDGEGAITRLRVTKWTPAAKLPRWASRIQLEVTSVRVERLQEISEDDARAEGVVRVRDACHVIRGYDYDLSGLCHTSAITPFQSLWDSINGKRAPWDSNPWVWVVGFKRVEAE